MAAQPDARSFTESWADAWNRHDLDAIMALFAEDATFSSPLIHKLGISDDGIVRGKAALRAYWAFGLEKVPDLQFDVTSVVEGVDLIVIGFRNELGVDRSEILKFRDGLVVEGHGTYPAR